MRTHRQYPFFAKLRYVGIPLLSLVLTVLIMFLFNVKFASASEMLKQGGIFFLYNMLFTSVIWLGCEYILYYLEDRLPWQKHTLKRLTYQTLLILAYTTVVNLLLCALINYFNARTVLSSQNVLTNLIICWSATIFMNMLVAGIYFFREWKSSLLETETLKKEQLRSQFELLKNQVNPHFLFNTLNTLSALIEEEPKKAGVFVTHMAEVYRYVLTARDQDVVTLSEELNCLESFIYLNKMRFEDKLQMQIDIAENCKHKMLLPMSLQILVENAIKHNVISDLEPLAVQIVCTEKGVEVRNKINLKSSVKSNGIGLNNLKLRYQAIGVGAEMLIKEEHDHFVVYLPFIQHSA